MLLLTSAITLCCLGQAPVVEVIAEEDVYPFVNPNNGSGPLWSFGCTPIVRVGDDVVVSQMETGEGVPLLCNTRWILRRRSNDGRRANVSWRVIAEADGYRQREPTSLGVTSDGAIYLNVNDSTEPPGTKYGACDPHILTYSLADPSVNGRRISPTWVDEPYFTDHSYRGFAVDSTADRVLMLNIDAKTSVQNWCLLTPEGDTIRNGQITFPIRSCYPQVALKKGAGHVLAIGDIVEPVGEWRTYKHEQTGRDWDYVFRILHYTWTPDIAKQDFARPIEIANVDETAGHIMNQDMWIAPDGAAYILYTEREVQSALMRDKFFPGKSTRAGLHLAVVRDGRVESKRVLIEGTAEQEVGCGRFHEMPGGTLYAVLYVAGTDAGNKLMQIYPPQDDPPLIPIALRHPFGSFSLATVRAGCKPSSVIDLFGHAKGGDTLSYAQVRIGE
jgi:hypothetical protein